MRTIYLDNGASTKVDPEVLKAMQPYFTEKYGNASSEHHMGRLAREAIENSRKTIAKLIGAKAGELIFTSGGTESNNFALKGLAWAHKGKADHIITTKIEHECILQSCKWLEKQGFRITYLDVDKEGFVNLDQLERAIGSKTFLVSIIHGNNEIGTIQNLREIGKICKRNNVLFHTDACQSFTKTELDVKKFNLDLVTLNSHKIHGPKGVGALYIKEGVKIVPLLHGGGHEFGLRSGTENVHGIVGFATAAKLGSNPKHIAHMERLRDKLIDALLEIPKTKLNGARGKHRLPNNVNICFTDVEGEAIGSYLDAKGICVSTASACASRKLEPSHVLLAIGLTPQEANASLRITISRFTKEEEIEIAIQEIKKAVEKMRRISPLANIIKRL